MIKRRFDGRIGDVYMMMFSGCDSEQTGWRPGLIVQNNVGNRHSPNVIALPFTSSLKKAGQPTHVIIRAKDSGLMCDSMLLCENPERMSKSRIGEYITTLPKHYMSKVAEASILATSMISYLELKQLQEVWERAVALNGISA